MCVFVCMRVWGCVIVCVWISKGLVPKFIPHPSSIVLNSDKRLPILDCTSIQENPSKWDSITSTNDDHRTSKSKLFSLICSILYFIWQCFQPFSTCGTFWPSILIPRNLNFYYVTIQRIFRQTNSFLETLIEKYCFIALLWWKELEMSLYSILS